MEDKWGFTEAAKEFPSSEAEAVCVFQGLAVGMGVGGSENDLLLFEFHAVSFIWLQGIGGYKGNIYVSFGYGVSHGVQIVV